MFKNALALERLFSPSRTGFPKGGCLRPSVDNRLASSLQLIGLAPHWLGASNGKFGSHGEDWWTLLSHLCPLYNSIGCLGFHTDQEQAIPSLIAAAIHKLTDSPAELLLIHPPAIPPIKIISTAPSLRFLLTLSAFKIFGSLAKSQYTLVNTVVGTSLKPRSLDVTICPPDWNARKPSGINSMKLISPFCVTTPWGSGTTCACTRAAATIMHIDWRRKDTPRVPRALGFMSRVFAKVKQPSRKKNMEMRDFAQP